MKKIPTLFIREFKSKNEVELTSEVTPGMEFVLEGLGKVTIKIDGSATAIIKGEFYKRYDVKEGKVAPVGAIPCCEKDPITKHHPHWVKVDKNNSSDKWLIEAYKNSNGEKLSGCTYEAIGPHFQNNPCKLEKDVLERHGIKVVQVERTYEGIKKIFKGKLYRRISLLA